MKETFLCLSVTPAKQQNCFNFISYDMILQKHENRQANILKRIRTTKGNDE